MTAQENKQDSLVKRVAAKYLQKHGFLVEAMSNLRSNRTGVDGAVIWISAGEFAGSSSPHGPRIKVVLGDKITTEGLKDAVSVTIEDSPRVLGTLPGKIKKQAIRFVKTNSEALLRHWKWEIDSAEVIALLKRV